MDALIPDILSRVLYRDSLVLILNKPAGIAVHGGPGKGPNLDAALGELRFGYKEKPELAHRLDRDTSGCLALGRNARALRKLGHLFAEGRAEKTYWAIVRGAPPSPQGRINAPLKKLMMQKQWRMVVDAQGQESITDYRLLGSADGLSWLELKPRTGRTHQIRVHCAHLGCPVLGDAIYDPVGGLRDPLHLHARALCLPLYEDKPAIAVEAPPPDHMVRALQACGLH